LSTIYKTAWPNLKITVANVNPAYIAKFVQRLDSGKDQEKDVKRYAKAANVHPEMTDVIPVKQNYVFKGWTLDPTLVEVDEADVATLIANGDIYEPNASLDSLTFDDNGNDVFTFYAVFAIRAFTIHFVDPQDTTFEYTSYKAPYGSYLHEPDMYIVTDESGISETERYKLMGWSREIDSQTNNLYTDPRRVKTLDLTKIQSQNIDQTFYGVYLKEDCLTNATDDKWFNFILNSPSS